MDRDFISTRLLFSVPVFGIVFMTMTGLRLGHFIELTAKTDLAVETILIARPVIQLIFILVQLYFIFVNSSVSQVQFTAILSNRTI